MTFRAAALFALLRDADSCTNMLVSAGASTDGSTHIAYNADSGGLYGSLGHYPAADHAPGSVRDIWDWDGSFYLGSIPEASHTYNVIGNTNEHGLTIGETTFGGRSELNAANSGGIMDYGSLIWVTLQRATSARDAIKTIDSLLQTHGYASDGESFSIGDPHEAWLMEIIGKGPDELGAVWVATRVPDGYVGSHANQARTRTFKAEDPDNFLFAKDVITFAQQKGYFPKSSPASEFSFADAYDPISFGGARFCEARVWNIFNHLTEGMEKYLDYAQGYNLTNRMPLFIKPSHKLSVNDTMWSMRTHFEGSWFDPTGTTRADVGAGPGNSAYRWRPLTWKDSKGQSFVNERTVSVQQTAWNFVAQQRPNMPAPMASLFWWAPDDSGTALRVPIYGGATRVPLGFADPVGQAPGAAVAGAPAADAFTMSLDSAFWIWNLVANIGYGERYNVAYPRIQAKINELEGQLIMEVAAVDAKAKQMYAKNPAAAVEYVTAFGEETGSAMLSAWRNFWMELFSLTRDGFTITPPTKPQCRSGSGKENCTARAMPVASASGYSQAWCEYHSLYLMLTHASQHPGLHSL